MQVITVIAVLALSVLVLRYIVKRLFKILFFLLLVAGVVIALYLGDIGPFNKVVNLDYIETKFCEGELKTSNKCVCIVEPIASDMRKRFSGDELAELNADKFNAAYTLLMSFDKKKTDIKQCLAASQAEAELGEFFTSTFGVNVGNVSVESLMKVLEKLYGESKEAVDTLNKKYQNQ